MTVQWDVKGVMDRVKRAVSAGVEDTAEYVKNDAIRRIIEPPKTGRIYAGAPYRIGKPPHQASAPGESPADDSGTLRRSGRTERKGDLSFEVAFGGRGGVDYARELEFGMFQTDPPLLPRPFLRPAVEEGRKVVKQLITRRLRR
jgi:hypothetical protein